MLAVDCRPPRHTSRPCWPVLARVSTWPDLVGPVKMARQPSRNIEWNNEYLVIVICLFFVIALFYLLFCIGSRATLMAISVGCQCSLVYFGLKCPFIGLHECQQYNNNSNYYSSQWDKVATAKDEYIKSFVANFEMEQSRRLPMFRGPWSSVVLFLPASSYK